MGVLQYEPYEPYCCGKIGVAFLLSFLPIRTVGQEVLVSV
jgi:hypothetical protein